MIALLLAAAVTLTAKPAKTEVTVGETFAVEVEVKGPAGTTWTCPAAVEGDTIDLHANQAAAPAAPDRCSYTASVFALTDVAVPPIAVSYRLPDGTTGEAATTPVPLRVTSLLPREPGERQLADIRPPVDIPTLPREFWLALLRALTHSVIGVLALVAAGALAWWLWHRRRKRRALAPAPPPAAVVPADAEALAALDRLAASGRLEREEYRLFYIELTEIAKRYLERRLQAPVLEMTTAETLGFLRRHPHGNAFVNLVSDVSGAADQVKFARGRGARERAETHLGAARRLVVDLEARFRPVYLEPPPGTARKVS